MLPSTRPGILGGDRVERAIMWFLLLAMLGFVLYTLIGALTA